MIFHVVFFVALTSILLKRHPLLQPRNSWASMRRSRARPMKQVFQNLTQRARRSRAAYPCYNGDGTGVADPQIVL